ncbi:LCP family protein [Streptomyces kronopolitis]|uniref:LCP family protein n=1 Tax=Streptomyces kronopolitis TaxID=1612435 RepID=UPI0036B2CEC6
MNDWLNGSPDINRYGGEAEPAHAVTGQTGQRAPHPPQPVPARPLPADHGGDPYGTYGAQDAYGAYATHDVRDAYGAQHIYGAQDIYGAQGTYGSDAPYGAQGANVPAAPYGHDPAAAPYDHAAPYDPGVPARTGASPAGPAFPGGGDGGDGGPGPHGGLPAPGGPDGPVGPLRRRPTRQPPTRPTRRRRLLRLAGLLVVVSLLTSVGTYTWADTKLERDVDLGGLAGRPAPGKGANYLIVGSDSRQGLSGKDIKHLHTGGSADAGRRTDSMILLHTGAHGTTMMSLPRDSWVTIPPYTRPETGKHYPASKDKLNAAFAHGGPELLVRTIERNTGLQIGHYTEIGFAGFVGIVDAVGGVPMCLNKAVKDKKSGENLSKGCHTLDGRSALAFVRQRHQEAQGDLGRSRNQQKFLAALSHKTATPGTLLDPSKVYPTMNAGLDTLVVDKSMSLWNLTSLFKAMKSVSAGDGARLHVPVSSLNLRTPKGSAVKWDARRAATLFGELRDDRPVSARTQR